MKIINILLVEDDELDIMHLKRTLDKMQLVYKLEIAKNGEEAIKALRGGANQEPHRLPHIVLIDINMPRMNGLEFLQVIRNTEEWKHLNCFIITTSEEGIDKKEAQRLGVSGYIVKPLKLSHAASMDVFNLMIDLMNTKD